MPTKTIKELFNEYREACYGSAPLNQTQEEEVKQAFMAGAIIVFDKMNEISKLPPDSACDQLGALEQEIVAENFRRASELAKRKIIQGN